MGCNGNRRLLFLWVDRERAPLPRKPFERHLEICPDCRQRALEVERIVLMFRAKCSRREVPAGLADRIRGLLEQI
jgi:predicted anti-sigma-YlaC factor YlaD